MWSFFQVFSLMAIYRPQFWWCCVHINGAQDVEISTSRFLNNEASSPTSYTRYGGAAQISNVGDVSLCTTVSCVETLPRSFSALSAYGGALYAGNVEELSITNVISSRERLRGEWRCDWLWIRSMRCRS